MQIYIGHSTSFDYEKELYQPVKSSHLCKQHHIIFPHEKNTPFLNSKEIIFNCDLFIAEVSYASTGLGIELGWASLAACKIHCIAKQGSKISSSLKVICPEIVFYSDEVSMMGNIESFLG